MSLQLLDHSLEDGESFGRRDRHIALRRFPGHREIGRRSAEALTERLWGGRNAVSLDLGFKVNQQVSK